MKLSLLFILAASLSLNSLAQNATKEPPKSQTLLIDPVRQQFIEQIMGLDPSLQVKKCDVVIESGGAIFKLSYGEHSKAESEKKLWDLLKKTHPKDVLFIDNIYVIKDGKLMKLMGQKAFTIQ